MITARQCRAARALLGWSQGELADRSGVAQATIANFETEKRATYVTRIIELEKALEQAGIEFGDLARSAVMLNPDCVTASAPPAHRQLSPLRVVHGPKKAVRLETRYEEKKVVVNIEAKAIDDYFCTKFTKFVRIGVIEENLSYILDIVEHKIENRQFSVNGDAVKSVITIDIGETDLKKYLLFGLSDGQVPYAGLPEDKYAKVISISMSAEKSAKTSAKNDEAEE